MIKPNQIHIVCTNYHWPPSPSSTRSILLKVLFTKVIMIRPFSPSASLLYLSRPLLLFPPSDDAPAPRASPTPKASHRKPWNILWTCGGAALPTASMSAPSNMGMPALHKKMLPPSPLAPLVAGLASFPHAEIRPLARHAWTVASSVALMHFFMALLSSLSVDVGSGLRRSAAPAARHAARRTATSSSSTRSRISRVDPRNVSASLAAVAPAEGERRIRYAAAARPCREGGDEYSSRSDSSSVRLSSLSPSGSPPPMRPPPPPPSPPVMLLAMLSATLRALPEKRRVMPRPPGGPPMPPCLPPRPALC
mmetsp:Transcript_18192/g.33886  ORF Transcript_18192/g.33886 Transcript_18192/m.33886 type:complete len:308 (+) Transcript_18192:2-925(+)